MLAALGAEPIEAPMIRILPPEDRTPLLRAAGQLDVFDWIVFTSANAVDSLMHAVLESGGDVRSLKGPQLCAIGSATGRAAGEIRHQGRSHSAGVQGRRRGERAQDAGDARRRPRAAAARRHRPRGHRRAAARGRRARHRRRGLSQRARRSAGQRRARHLPDAARRRDPGGHLHERLGGAQLHEGARRRAGRRSAEEDHRGGHRPGDRRGGGAARHRHLRAARHLHGAGARGRHRGPRGRAARAAS